MAWHPAILATLIKRDCPRYLVCIVRSFLSKSTSIFSHNSTTLLENVNLGCPQGGVLSPFLWNLMINDILRLSFPFLFRIIAYADDLTVTTSHKDSTIAKKNLQIICNPILDWC
jgi:hypothetical protein